MFHEGCLVTVWCQIGLLCRLCNLLSSSTSLISAGEGEDKRISWFDCIVSPHVHLQRQQA